MLETSIHSMPIGATADVVADRFLRRRQNPFEIPTDVAPIQIKQGTQHLIGGTGPQSGECHHQSCAQVVFEWAAGPSRWLAIRMGQALGLCPGKVILELVDVQTSHGTKGAWLADQPLISQHAAVSFTAGIDAYYSSFSPITQEAYGQVVVRKLVKLDRHHKG
jgi:hypothetical protein